MGLKIVTILSLLAVAASGQMGSPGEGETQAVALHPTDPKTIYAGAARGLCKDTRGGLDDWPSSGLETLSPRVIVIDPESPETVYAGTYESGVHKTTDGAATWEAKNDGLDDLRIRALLLHDGNLYAGTDGGGLFKSNDEGEHWRPINRGLMDKVVRALIALPDGTLLAGTWHGVYRSADQGERWQADLAGLYDVDVRALAVDPRNSHRVYAGTNPRGVYRSDDGGRTWHKSKNPLTEFIYSVAVDPASGDVYAGTKAGVFRSRDRGDSWETAGLRWSSRAWTLVFDDRTQPPTLYYGGEGGVLKTQNGGVWWDVTGHQRK